MEGPLKFFGEKLKAVLHSRELRLNSQAPDPKGETST